MAQALRKLGYELDDAPLRARAAEGKSIGRPHLARAAVSHPANQARLEEEGLTDPSAFLVEYLIEGKPAFRSRTIPSVPESIDAIHEAGGLAIWAHPFWTIPEADTVLEMLDDFREVGNRRRRVLLRDPHPRAGGGARRPLRRARPAHDRVIGLPRPGPP